MAKEKGSLPALVSPLFRAALLLACLHLGDAHGTVLCSDELHGPCSDVLLLFPQRSLGFSEASSVQ